MARVIKDGFFIPLVEESGVVTSKEDMHATHTVDLFVPNLFPSILPTR